MRIFDEEERNEIESIMIYYIRTANDYPRNSGMGVDIFQEFKKHGLLNANYFKNPTYKKIMKILIEMHNEEIPINSYSFKKYIEEKVQSDISEKNEILTNFLVTKSEVYYSYMYLEYYMAVFKEHLIMDYWNYIFDKYKNHKWQTNDILVNSFGIIDGFKALWDKITSRVIISPEDDLKAQAILQRENMRNGISTSVTIGLKEFDEFTGGFENTELYIIGARPAMGKTTFSIGLIKKIIEKNKRVIFFTLEMTRKQLINKFVADDLKISYKDLKRGYVSDDDFEKVLKLYDFYDNHPFLVVDELPSRTLSDLKNSIKDTDIVFIDYLQLLRIDVDIKRKPTNREQEVGMISQNLKSFAKELRIPIVALAQLSRGVESRPGHRPQLSDLRESGSMEQDADVIMFLFREAYYLQQKNQPVHENQIGNTELIIAKGREIGTGTLLFNIDFSTNTISEGFKY